MGPEDSSDERYYSLISMPLKDPSQRGIEIRHPRSHNHASASGHRPSIGYSRRRTTAVVRAVWWYRMVKSIQPWGMV